MGKRKKLLLTETEIIHLQEGFLYQLKVHLDDWDNDTTDMPFKEKRQLEAFINKIEAL